MNQDLEHLRLLSIFHYVVAGIAALCACIPIFHLGFGLLMLFNPDAFNHRHQNDVEVMRIFGLVMAAFAGVIILLGWSFAVCVVLAGRNLARRRRYTFCLVIAALLCVFMPFGTVLGVFSVIVLVRPSVKSLFDERPAAAWGVPSSG